MQRTEQDDPFRVVIAGGGVAGLEALVALRATARTRLDVTLISPRDDFAYRPLEVGEPFGLGRPHPYALAEIAGDLAARHVRASVAGVDPAAREVLLDDGDRIGFDAALLAVGAVAVPAYEHGVNFDRAKDPEPFDELLEDLRAGLAPSVAVVVPPGTTWTLPAYELALLTAAWGAQVRPEGVRVTLVTTESSALEAFGPAAGAVVADRLAEAGVRLMCGVEAQPESGTALRAGGHWVQASRIVSLPVIAGPRLGGAPADALGFVTVDDRAAVAGSDRLFAAGDGTTHPVKQGGLAAQQADVAAAQIARLAGTDVPDVRYRPVLRGLLRTSRGPLYLRADPDDPVRTSVASEQALWWPPSKLASRWLAPYLARLDAERPEILPSGGVAHGRAIA
jgi:sulfide:quinone oxidoreductase